LTIEYASYDPKLQEIVCFSSYAEAVADAADKCEVWLLVDGWPVLSPMPDSFDRLVIAPGEIELRSAVARRHEIEPLGAIPRTAVRHREETYGGEAPLLTIDKQNETVHLRHRVGDDLEQYRVLWPEGDDR
jgi:hypothetical protein